jgi:hypothetical protein
MRDTLKENPNLTVFLEFMPLALSGLGFEPSDLIEFFVERNFKIYQVHSGGKLTEGLPSAKKDSDYFDLLFSRRPMACDGEL